MKRSYLVPNTKTLAYRTDSLLYQASVPYGGENNDQPDEAKQGVFEEDSETTYSLPSINYDVWAEETESESFFHKK